jgi:hypothetical protein
MKTFAAFLILNFVCLNISAQNLVWARSIGAAGDDVGNSISTDAAGNVFTTGHFEGLVDFDPGAGTYTLPCAGKKDIFISELDAAGNFQWAIALGDTGFDRGTFIAHDPSGNLYVTGDFSGTIDFDPGPGVNLLTSTSTKAVFILKFNSLGNLVWAKSISNSGPYNGMIVSLCVDLAGNVYTTAEFSGTVDFDPGSGIYNVTYPLTGGFGSFVLKLDPSGNFIWVKTTGGAVPSFNSGTIWSSAIAVDAAQNVYSAGRFVATVDFDPSAATYTLASDASSYDVYISKLNANGNFVWAKAFSGPDNDWCASLTLDVFANLYICGLFGATVDFDPGPGTNNLVSAGLYDAFIAKMDSAGSLIWAKRFGGTGSEGAYSLVRDLLGNIYTTGWFDGTADFNPGPSTYNLSSAGNFDAFISKLDNAGNFVSAQKIGGPALDGGNDMTLDAFGNILLTGIFNGICDFDPTPAILSLTSAGANDIFITKFGNCTYAITSQPANYSSSIGNTAQFVVGSSNTGSTFQWQQNSGNGFIDLTNTLPYSGVTSATLVINNLILAQNNYSFRCIVTYSNCITASNSAVLKVLDLTGIEKLNDESHFTIFPNPSKDLIRINSRALNADFYSITDQTGREIINGKLDHSGTTIIDIGSFAAGLYIIQVGTENKKSMKIIKL